VELITGSVGTSMTNTFSLAHCNTLKGPTL